MLDQQSIDAYRRIGDILVILEGTDKKTYCKGFKDIDEVCEYIGALKFNIQKVLKGKKIHGSTWRPNIYYKNLGNGNQHRYIVVYTEDWINYSNRQRSNRINKLIN